MLVVQERVDSGGNHNGSLNGDEVVISGISGEFPCSDDTEEFMKNLYNKVDMITEESSFDHPETPKYLGKVRGFKKFDPTFFKMTPKQGMAMDPMTRKLLENAYGAIYDAGVNPLTLKGGKVGVFVGGSFTDSASISLYNTSKRNVYIVTGNGSKSMCANRITYWIDSKSPSCTIDCTCSSSMVCLQLAHSSIKQGESEAAIVGGCNFCLSPSLSLSLNRAGLLCMEGKSKCFDKRGDGFVRSDAVGVLFLQKSKDAKRIYAEVIHTKVEYGLNADAQFLPTRKSSKISDFLRAFYSELDVSPDDVEYIEANATGIAEADANELEAIEEVFGEKKIIKVGSVISNMGHSEAASGVCAIIKICLAYFKGELPPNIHYTDPLKTPNGKVKVLQDPATFNRGFTAANNFSFTGVNSHVLLKGHFKKKEIERYKNGFPYLVLVSGRTKYCVTKIFNILKKQPADPEQIGLLHNIHSTDITGHTSRGYVILSNKDKSSLGENVDFFSGNIKPLWFVYSGMGSQWPAMGAALLSVPSFSAAIERCRKVLEPKGVDIIKILTDKDKTIFDNILNSFVGIAAVQIGLTDILKELGVKPDNIIGHSVGEFGCAYADGCFTTEEMILSAYYRGLVSIQTPFIHGAMAAVGLGYKKIKPICPPEIEVACRNSAESCTISGPSDAIKEFVNKLRVQGIFTKEVHVSNIAYHSKYIADAGPILLEKLKEVIKNPRPRSKKWICTSLPPEKWNDPVTKYSSAEYHTNNLVSPVYFEEATKEIPENAVLIEISPHGLLQAILRKSHTNCSHIPLTRRWHSNPVKFLLEAVGKLYQQGYNPKIQNLYPKIKFPVSTETALLSPLIGWNHSEDWPEAMFETKDEVTAPSRELVISITDDDYKFLQGCIRNGETVLPEAALLFFVWETVAMYKNIDLTDLSVVFSEVNFHGEVFIEEDELITLTVMISRVNNIFEVSYNNISVVTGSVTENKSLSINDRVLDSPQNETYDISLPSADVYRLMHSKGYGYKGDFQTILCSNLECNQASIKWNENWITLIDSLIQLNVLSNEYYGLGIPKVINKIIIDMEHHKSIKGISIDGVYCYDANIYSTYGITRCAGVEIENIIFEDKPRKVNVKYVVEKLTYFSDIILDSPDTDVQSGGNYYLPVNNAIYNENSRLTIEKPGEIDSLVWLHTPTAASDNLIKVTYAGISVRDCQKAVGISKSEKSGFGMDFSGIDVNGNRVMGLIKEGALATTVKADSDLLWPVPEHWTLEDAASVPLPYIHAYYCLAIREVLRRGQTVFVNGGAGAMGQAVISICLTLNCEVFTTVSSVAKKSFLLKLFPGLKEHHIDDSRDECFYKVVLLNSRTLCDFVINCASGSLRKAAMKCVNPSGIFLDVNDYDMKENKDFGMHYLQEFKAYKAVQLSSIFRPENAKEKNTLQMMVAEGIANGTVRPLTRVIFPMADVPRAFRFLCTNNHRGRVLVKMNDVDIPSRALTNNPIATSSETGVYIVICDDNGIGIHLVDYLIKRDGSLFVVHLNSESTPGVYYAKLVSWKKLNASINIQTGCIKTKEDCLNVIKKGKSLGEIKGIFIEQESTKKEMLLEEINNSRSIVGDFDQLSRTSCPNLIEFVIICHTPEYISGEYTVLASEKMCEARNNMKLPALALKIHITEECIRKYGHEFMNAHLVSSVFKAIDFSQTKKLTNIRITSKLNTTKKSNALQQISKILHINNIYDIKEDLTVGDLIKNDVVGEEIRASIKTSHKVDLAVNQIKELSISSLKTLCGNEKKFNNKFAEGFEEFFSFVDKDECVATEPVVAMTTILNTTQGKKEEIDSKALHLMLVPGLEGHHHIFKSLCKRLKIPAVTLQLGPDVVSSSLEGMAMDLYKFIKNKFEFKTNFYLLGYSFGVNVALELARIMEKQGLVGVVYCLDSSPDAFRIKLDDYTGKMADDELQNAILEYIYQLLAGEENQNLKQELNTLEQWPKKVDTFMEKLKGKVTYTKQYIRAIVEEMYKRIILARSYEPRFKLESQLVLIKGTSHPNANLEHDYNLSKYSKQSVKVFDIKSDHANTLFDCRVPNIVNKLLSSEILEEFKKKNLCDKYFINQNTL